MSEDDQYEQAEICYECKLYEDDRDTEGNSLCRWCYIMEDKDVPGQKL